MNYTIRYAVLLIVCTAVACKSFRPAAGTVPEVRALAYLLDKIAANRVETDWLSARASISLESPEMNISFTSNIRLMKDSIIWINFKKLSIEAARACITKDSVFVINYLSKQYIARDLNFIEENFNLPASFDMLQDVLLGNPVQLDSGVLSVDVDTFSYILSGSSGGYNREYWFDAATYGMKKMNWTERRSQEKVAVSQNDFSISWKGAPFPLHRHIEYLDAQRTLRALDIQFSEVAFRDPKPLRFEVPEHYERI